MQEGAGSSPVTRTNNKGTVFTVLLFLVCVISSKNLPNAAGVGSRQRLRSKLALERSERCSTVLLPAPNSRNPNPKPVGEGFGFFCVFAENEGSGDM